MGGEPFTWLTRASPPAQTLPGGQSIFPCCPFPTHSTLVMLAVGTRVQLACDNSPSQLERLLMNLFINLLKWKPSCFPRT